ncbi:hypothetical protein [Rhizobium phage RHph_X3_9]|nr:hypothetical protein [Rhizobium phage RHph_X3_9]
MDTRQIDEATRFVTDLFDMDFDTVIAGGFVRDTLLGGEVRDIDLYCYEDDYGVLAEYLFGPEWFRDMRYFQQGDDEYDHQYISQQVERKPVHRLVQQYPEILLLGQRPINLIGIGQGTVVTGECVTGLFNLTSSQAWIDRSGLHTSNGFDVGSQHKMVQVLRSEWGREGTARCLRKFLAKYPAYKVIEGHMIYGGSEIERWLQQWAGPVPTSALELE